MKKIVAALLSVVVFIGVFIYTYASTYTFTVAFTENSGDSSIGVARYPGRAGSDFHDYYYQVASKCNQARNVASTNTNPHQGVDLGNMSEGTDVYAIFPGKVTVIVWDTSEQLAYVIQQCDVNGDSILDQYWVKYQHIVPLPGLYVNMPLLVSNKIGDVQGDIDPSDPNVGYDPHLHFGVKLNSYSVWGSTSRFYYTSSDYNYGRDMDVFAGNYNTGNIFHIYNYTKSNGNSGNDWGRVNPLYIYMYYRYNGGAWNTTPITLNQESSANHLYDFDFASLSGVGLGTTITYYLASFRNASGTYDKWSLWPQYYNHPPYQPADFGTNPIQTQSITITDDYPDSLASAWQITLNTIGRICYISYHYDHDWFKFTVPVSAYYSFYTDGALDTYGALKNGSGSVLASDDDSRDGHNFQFTYYLVPGTTYYLDLSDTTSETGQYNLTIMR